MNISLFDVYCIFFELVWQIKWSFSFPGGVWRSRASWPEMFQWHLELERRSRYEEDDTGLRGGADQGRGCKSEEPLKRLISSFTLLRQGPSYLYPVWQACELPGQSPVSISHFVTKVLALQTSGIYLHQTGSVLSLQAWTKVPLPAGPSHPLQNK